MIRDEPVVQQCVAWCAMKGLEPLSVGSDMDEVLRLSAIIDNRTPFVDLNERQRRYIAGAVA